MVPLRSISHQKDLPSRPTLHLLLFLVSARHTRSATEAPICGHNEIRQRSLWRAFVLVHLQWPLPPPQWPPRPFQSWASRILLITHNGGIRRWWKWRSTCQNPAPAYPPQPPLLAVTGRQVTGNRNVACDKSSETQIFSLQLCCNKSFCHTATGPTWSKMDQPGPNKLEQTGPTWAKPGSRGQPELTWTNLKQPGPTWSNVDMWCSSELRKRTV